MKPLALLLLVVGCASTAQATPDATVLLGRANHAYQAGQYAVAAQDYQALIDAGSKSADVYFDLGTAFLKAGRRGQAILAYERALRLDPDDSDAAYNLAQAKRGNIDKVVGSREEEPLLERVGAEVPARAVGVWFLATWLGGLALLLVRRYSPKRRGLVGLVGVASVVVAVAAGLLLFAAAWHQKYATYAIVVSPSAAVREGPAADFRSAFEIHEGLKVRVMRQDRGFLRIRLPNGSEGWVSARDAPVI